MTIQDSYFDDAVTYVLQNEGGFVDDVSDEGGATNFGISLRFLRSLSTEQLASVCIYSQPDKLMIEHMTVNQAKLIYRVCFYDNFDFDYLDNQLLINQVFDFSVTSGLAEAIKTLQRAINVCAHTDLVCDGIFGELSKSQYDIIYNAGRLGMLIKDYQDARAYFYREIVQNNPSQAKFLDGWLHRAYRINVLT